MGILILLLFLLILIAPELLILLGTFIVVVLYGIGEFILRLFGKSFEDKKDEK
jgi:Na+-transporting methylmalonyl-CoA/oxaloacetate decarboxylase gamma subunit